MKVDVNFSNIREYDGSRANGFEELVCQLARLSPPVNGKTFIRKEGAGGDAGVECFWICEDGTEYAWQAKYFVETLGNSQWSQIDDSVKTAIQKHPNIVEYYVCIPKDRNDSRKENQEKKEVSFLDKWNSHVKRWTEWGKSSNRNIIFRYWGKSEILNILQKDNSIYAGKILYWFDCAAITSEKLIKIANHSKDCLGDRFTPENHVELPISEKLEYISFGLCWRKKKKEFISDSFKCRSDLYCLVKLDVLNEMKDTLDILIQEYEKFSTIILEWNNSDEQFLEQLNILLECTEKIEDLLDRVSQYLFRHEAENEKEADRRRNATSLANELSNKFYTYQRFFSSNKIRAAKERKVLVTGEAGSGKSHLLCDFALKRLADKLPTVFLLGEHYAGGDPVKFLVEELELQQYDIGSVLGALDAFGENYMTKTLIIIDAINEGNYRSDWYSYLGKFLSVIKEYKNLAVILSCRDTYKDYIISKDVLKNMPELIHYGFKGFEKRAALKYLGRQGINIPAIPFLSPEFSNPLFLKITCKSMKELGLKEFPEGLDGYIQIFDFYLESIQNIVKRIKLIHRNDIISNIVEDFVKELYPIHLWGIPIELAEQIVNKYDNPHYGETSIFDLLIHEGLLALDIETDKSGRKTEVVRFTYERFSDFMIAKRIVSMYENKEMLKTACHVEGELYSLINSYEYSGIVKALGVVVPEKFHCEFVNIMNIDKCNHWKKTNMLEDYFLDILLFRSKASFTDETLDIFNELDDLNQKLDYLLAISTEPHHPWNALRLNIKLLKCSMPERDSWWSTYVAMNDSVEEDGQKESPVRTIINWILEENLLHVENERLYLTAVVLLWCTTTSRRMTRNDATKALAKVFTYIPDEIVNFLEDYSKNDDLYLVSSLYAAVYGAVVNFKEYSEIESIVKAVIGLQFSNKYTNPHILIRDYARGILEYANIIGCKIIGKIEQYRPPYESNWSIEDVLPSEIESIDNGDYSSIKSSVIGGLNDFGRYTMANVKCWTATALSEVKPKTCRELLYKFVEEIPSDFKDTYIEVLDIMLKKEEEQSIKANDFLDALLSGDVNFNFLEEENEEDKGEEIENIEEQCCEEFWEYLNNVLDERNREYLKWLKHNGISNRIAIFNTNLGRRWIVKRCYQMGWNRKLFENFERIYCNDSYRRNGGLIERIGKKYQWIAYHELLGYLADNYYFADRGYDDLDHSKYGGAWQIDIRELDPTLWCHSKKEMNYDDTRTCWWRPYCFEFSSENLNDMKDWLWNVNSLPNFKPIIKLIDEEKNEWLNLYTFCSWTKKALLKDDEHGEPKLWYRVNSCIIQVSKLNEVKNAFNNKQLRSPDLVYIPESRSQRFCGEYPWHPCYDYVDDWIEKDEEYDEKMPCKYHIPLYEYRTTNGGFDHMDDEIINFYMPSKKIILDLQLEKSSEKPWKWYKDGEVVFQDKGMECETQSIALFRKATFQEWLKQEGLVLVWLIGGEKELFTPHVTYCFGRLNYSALYYMDGSGKIEGQAWSEREEPHKV